MAEADAGMARHLAEAMHNMANAFREMQVSQEQITQALLRGRQGQNDELDETERELPPGEKRALEFLQKAPTFERGKDRWTDFSNRFLLHRAAYKVTDAKAKNALWNAVMGKSSRIVIASMRPDQGDCAQMTFDQYMTRIGEKFTPASESMQMKSEYKSRIQGKDEDVQNYINEKFEMFKLAYPGAQDMSDFYVEATKGVANKYVRNNLWGYRATSVENYGEMAVYWVQIERQRVAYGDSDSNTMEGLVPVTRNPKTGTSRAGGQRAEAMEVDHLRGEAEITDDESECECMDIHELGFKGPCYYCSKKGHMARSCPRKSAGLPKVRSPTGYVTNPNKGKPRFIPARKGQTVARNVSDRVRRRGPVNQVEETEESEEEEKEESHQSEDPEVTFLGEETL